MDYGTGAPVIGTDRQRRKTHVFRIVLSHSRKAYSEVCFRQTTEDFLRCLENAIWHFGGVPQTIVIDNLKAAVSHPDWYDPELTPKLRSFCRHYGTAILPTRPLQLPEDLATLPAPTPGGSNITDPTPEADAVAALGGNPAALSRKGIAAGDGGLVSYAARFGVAKDIRDVLAAEDLEFRSRKRGRPLERLFNVNVYYRAYLSQSLDQQVELERWRKAGVKNVGAPPDPVAP